MGGYGSTRWGLHRQKATVESCLSLSMKQFRDMLVTREQFAKHVTCKGSIKWNSGSEVGCKLEWRNDEPQLVLYFAYLDSEGKRQVVKQDIGFETTPCRYGGVRYWFTCPKCDRRCGRIHMGNNPWWACRKCHHLVYKSAQEAHHFDRGLFGSLGASFDYHERMNKLIKQQSRHQIGSKAWLRVNARIERLGAKIDAAIEATEAWFALVEADPDAALASMGIHL